MSLEAVIWGACGSLPCPATSTVIEGKIREALWAARDADFQSPREVAEFVARLPLSRRGTYKGNTSCVEIRADLDGEVLLCDAGTGIRDYAHSLGPDPAPRTYHIFISHLHWDHIQGFPFFTPAFQPGNRIVFHGFHTGMEAALLRQMDEPCFPVGFDSLRASVEFDLRSGESSFNVGGVEVRAIRQQHPGDSWGYRFEREGRSVVYSSDSEHGPRAAEEDYRFVDFFRGAEVLVFDGQYSLEESSNEKRNWGHSNQVTGVRLAARAGVRTLVIFHHNPANSDAELETLLERARAHIGASGPEEVLLAYDGLRLRA